MPLIEFSEEDLLRNQVVEPAWYRVLITAVGSKPSKSDNPGTTTVWPVEGKILFNADTGDKSHENVPTPNGWNFNDNPKARGFMIGFFKALGADPALGQKYELKNAEGKQIDVMIETDTYEGRLVNRINHKYRAPRS